jgi:type 2 lantibiotic biosynthesis protein LanM
VNKKTAEILGQHPWLGEGIKSLRAALMKRLAWLVSPVLLHEFKRFKVRKLSTDICRSAASLSGDENDRLAAEFLSGLTVVAEEIVSVHYPVLSDLIVREINRWAAHIQELFARLSQDRSSLSATLGLAPDDRLVSLATSGDTHRGGRSVCILRFASGFALVYKPRSLCIDVWYKEVLSWISAQPGVSLDITAPRILEREEYGWSEYIEYAPVSDERSEARFYQRMGMLLGLWMVLGGSDGHYENVIARGEYPFVVDTETLFDGVGHHVSRNSSFVTSAAGVCFDELLSSVKRVGFLPRYMQPNADTAPFDLSAIGLRAPIPAPFHQEDARSEDARSLGIGSSERGKLMPQGNAPSHRPGALGSDLIEAIERGFSEMYDLLSCRRHEVIARIKELSRNPRARVRIVPRQTHLYTRLVQDSISPECLRSGARRSIEIDRLSMKFTGRRCTRFDAQLLEAEIAAIENLDIPLFDVPLTFGTAKNRACSKTGAISRRSYGSPARDAIRRLYALNDNGRAFHLRTIRESLLIDDAFKSRDTRREQGELLDPRRDGCISTDRVWSVVLEIEKRIRESALSGGGGDLGWISPNLIAPGLYEQGYTGTGLWGGSSGIALFYAALYRVTGDSAFKQLSLKSLAPLQSEVRTALKQRKVNLQLLRDVYPLAVAARLQRMPEILESAEGLLPLVSARIFNSDSTYDVLGGSAGVILAMLSAEPMGSKEERLRIACLAADHLVNNRIATQSGSRAWKTLDDALGGFAHGAGGIALSLMRIASSTGEAQYYDVAQEALEYETSLYSADYKNWADMRGVSKGREPSWKAAAWCHGSTGIGLAYLAIEETNSRNSLQRQIAWATESSIQLPLPPSDTLCCGSFSRIALFDHLLRKTGDNQFKKLRDTLTEIVLERAVDRLRTVPEVEECILVPGFFNGLAGMGYELLRIYTNTDLPCVHMWDCGDLSSS